MRPDRSVSSIHAALPFLFILGCGGASAPAPQSGADGDAPPAGEPAESDAETQAAIRAALAGSHRSPENVARDRYRHPLETLSFFGLRQDMTVVELAPGRGWYTEVLAPVLRERGKLIAAGPAPTAAGYGGEISKAYRERLSSSPGLFDRVQTVDWTPPTPINLGPDESVDLVVTFRNIHGWMNANGEDQAYQAVFKVLRPGGTFGVVEHRARPGTSAAETVRTGYMPEEHVISRIEAAGFRLVGRSEVNANPNDTKDYPEGVWTLPPTLRLGDQDRDKYLAIGESDRMTLRFVKPE